MPGVIRFESTATQLAIGATITNLLSGTFLERLGPRPELFSVFGVVDDVAANLGLVTCDVRLGNVVVVDRGIIPAFTVRQGPDRDKHLIARAVGAPFDLCQVRLFNGGTAIAPYRFLVEATPL